MLAQSAGASLELAGRSDGNTALAHAVFAGSVPTVLALLSAGVTNFTCVCWMEVNFPMKPMCCHPLIAGADMCSQNNDGNTPLMQGCMESSCTTELCSQMLRAVC